MATRHQTTHTLLDGEIQYNNHLVNITEKFYSFSSR